MQPEKLAALETILDYSFTSKDLLQQAVSHKSAVADIDSYERLEFLGDRVLGLVLAQRLYLSYESADQGELTKRFHAQAQQSTLARMARNLGLQDFVIAENGNQLHERDSVLSDIVEAIIAAIYLDGGLDAAARLILAHLDWQAPVIAHLENPKSALQEWSDGKGMGLPIYREIERTGPNHELQFTVHVSVQDGDEATGTGTTGTGATGIGKSKKAAEFDAARNLLSKTGSK